MAHAPPSEPIGTRDITSTPPARTSSSMPERTLSAAVLTASSPDAQKRLSCTPATVSGRPAAMAAVLAMSPPWSPIGRDDAEHDVVDLAGVQLGVPGAHLADQADDQRHRLHLVQRARSLASAAWSADGVEDERLGNLSHEPM